MVTEILILYAICVVIGIVEYCFYEIGEGNYGEDRLLVVRKFVTWSLRLGMSIVFAKVCTNPISINEFWLYVCGFHLLSSLPTQGTYYQLKRWFGGETIFHFFSHSINGLIWRGDYFLQTNEKNGKLRYPILDLYAFMRIVLGIFGWIMLNIEYY